MNTDLLDSTAQLACLDPEVTRRLAKALRSVLIDAAAQGENVAVPGVGTFVTVKEDERIGRDLSTGGSVLLPPSLTMTFRTGTAMRNTLKNAKP